MLLTADVKHILPFAFHLQKAPKDMKKKQTNQTKNVSETVKAEEKLLKKCVGKRITAGFFFFFLFW